MKNSKKKWVKRGILIGILAIAIAVVVFFVSKDKGVSEIKLPELPVLSYFGITDESTTVEDIRIVERDMNNILISNGYGVKLYLAPEDRYDTMLASAKEMMAAYNENLDTNKYAFKYSFDYATSTFSWECDADTVQEYCVYNQDTLIERLDANLDNYPNTPSIDIVLYTDYADYYTAAMAGELVDLDAALSSEASDLKHSIPQVFLDAVKVGTSEASASVFGIPSVQLVGKYEFIVFDQDLLDKYSEQVTANNGDDSFKAGFSKNQMLTLYDLEEYLAVVNADTESGVYPLLNGPTTPMYTSTGAAGDWEVMAGNVFAADYSKNFEIPYTYPAFYYNYTTITKYRSMGYMAPSDADIKSADFAVAFYVGTVSELEALIEETGKNLVYNVYSKPIATSEEIGEAVFTVHSANGGGTADYEDFATNFVRLLNRTSGETDIKNILLYGANGINYTLSNENEVIYANGNTYSMNNLYTGHTFHAHASDKDGAGVDYIEAAKKHNFDLVISKFSGFNPVNRNYSEKDLDGNSVKIAGVDYIAVMAEVISKYSDAFLDGSLCAIDATDPEYIKSVEADIRADLAEKLESEFIEALRLKKYAEFEVNLRADASWMSTTKNNAATSAEVAVLEQAEKDMISDYNESAGEDAEAFVPTEDEIAKHREDNAAYYDALYDEKYEASIATAITVECKTLWADYQLSVDYAMLVEEHINSAEYADEFDVRLVEEYDELFARNLETQIGASLDEFSAQLTEELNTAIAYANAEFLAEVTANYPYVDIEELTVFNSAAEVMATLYKTQYADLKGEAGSAS